jgi:hypothetical protein
MFAPPLAAATDEWAHPNYRVRVRGTMFLWGSAGVTSDMTFLPHPLLLHVRNDVHGESITIGTQTASGSQVTFGTLDPGECLSIPIQNIIGVWALCALESNVSCLIKVAV